MKSHARFVDSFNTLSTFYAHGAQELHFAALLKLQQAGLVQLSRLPYCIRVLLESVVRAENGREVTQEHVRAMAAYDPGKPSDDEIPFLPARVLLQDFTGVPAIVDLAAMRSAMARLGGDPGRINPLIPVDLVVDHSVDTDAFGTTQARARNFELELNRNKERYEFLRWGQSAFDGLRVVPPGSGICHQVNLEYLASVVKTTQVEGRWMASFDTVVGTDSHTPMIGGLGVLGWGVGGIEAEAAMLGQPIYMAAPPVVGVHLCGALRSGATATDLVLLVTETLRKKGVVGKFVEYFGDGAERLSVPDRATLANMAPEYGATIGFFPVDVRTLEYLRDTGRPEPQVRLVEAYAAAQGLLRSSSSPQPQYQDVVVIDLDTVRACLAGPKRPQDRVELESMKRGFQESLGAPVETRGYGLMPQRQTAVFPVTLSNGQCVELRHGALAIAAITSCTNTSNPAVMLAAGLLADKAVARGLKVKPWVKTSLAPGSTVVTDYLQACGLMPAFEALGFHVVGYGCMTCIGNSGPLPEDMMALAESSDIILAGVLSGNRNFEGRINAHVRANYLASPPLVVAYALAGTVDFDFYTEPLGTDSTGEPVMLAQLWPTSDEVASLLTEAMRPEVFERRYAGIESSNPQWNAIEVQGGQLYAWSQSSTYIQEPPFFEGLDREASRIEPIVGARVLVKVGDSVTTDHISPAGSISKSSPAAQYLLGLGVPPQELNSYGSRRGNDRVMIRGTFANIRLINELGAGKEGWHTTHLPTREVTTIPEAAMRYRAAGTPLCVLAGKDYGMGSSRDWAAKGPALLGVRVVMAESFERIHRSNLVGMGILPLELPVGQTASTLQLNGSETFDVHLDDDLTPRQMVKVDITDEAGHRRTVLMRCRIDTSIEVDYLRKGGILRSVLLGFLEDSSGKE
ncbi:MAG: aconitate hydratase AcnA [Myxococcota bacterium]|nr:aconitate hydratase AcnA [Myxococcota bacterium]